MQKIGSAAPGKNRIYREFATIAEAVNANVTGIAAALFDAYLGSRSEQLYRDPTILLAGTGAISHPDFPALSLGLSLFDKGANGRWQRSKKQIVCWLLKTAGLRNR